ncbi:MAG: glycoside hydrolase family 2 protein, partial [Oscillospiraceae bacterium]|nr:glycoside hydrolase family 2 protein [Oscillospiraceae bacterium]
FNDVRVWGAGFYPSDAFYDNCDENGLIVWEDFMFACANYRLTDAFWETTEAELRDNIIRLRNHASLGLWCGNNEIETAFETWGLPDDPTAKADYLEQFEHRMPAIVQDLDPQRFYWRSSPSAHGGCKDTASNQAGDMHYWEIWHQFKPFTAFRELYYRFCSEYGFESIPSIKTLLTFCDPMKGDLNLMSPVMEAHQKCAQGNEKIMYYLAQMVRYPENMRSLIYASQLVQAEYIRSAVEHMRRHRGRCMGSVYWQLNDTNPVISWSSVDYYNRWKAVHYYARRFHAPVLLSAGAFGEPVFNISNETMQTVNGTVHWAIRDTRSVIVKSGEITISVPALSAIFLTRLEGLEQFYTPENRRKYYLSYELIAENGEVLSRDSSLLCVPKQFDFMTPKITLELRKLPEHYIISVTSDVFVQAAALDCQNIDVQFSDNWFALHGGETVYVTVPKREGLTLDILRRELFVMHQS